MIGLTSASWGEYLRKIACNQVYDRNTGKKVMQSRVKILRVCGPTAGQVATAETPRTNFFEHLSDEK
jgi:hypothetical protein